MLQIGVMLDKGIGQFLAGQPGHETFSLLGRSIRFPLIEGAAARLDLAQFMYQFPARRLRHCLATAIFPTLGREAINPKGHAFNRACRQGIEGSLFIGLPASVGMILVAEPAVRLLFEGGRFSAAVRAVVALSTAIYSVAIWAFSMLQIINRGVLLDARLRRRRCAGRLQPADQPDHRNPPALDAACAKARWPVGTLVSFAIQAIAMLLILSNRVGGLQLNHSAPAIGKMLMATLVMLIACVGLRWLPMYPAARPSKSLRSN